MPKPGILWCEILTPSATDCQRRDCRWRIAVFLLHSSMFCFRMEAIELCQPASATQRYAPAEPRLLALCLRVSRSKKRAEIPGTHHQKAHRELAPRLWSGCGFPGQRPRRIPRSAGESDGRGFPCGKPVHGGHGGRQRPAGGGDRTDTGTCGRAIEEETQDDNCLSMLIGEVVRLQAESRPLELKGGNNGGGAGSIWAGNRGHGEGFG